MASPSLHSQNEVLSMILVMGVTGSGKSYFVNILAGSEVSREGSDLESCTIDCLAIPAEIGRSKTLLIDTPGFDDSKRTDAEILSQISRLLAAQYEKEIPLKGVIYLHRITDTRYQGSSVKTLNIFKKICGQMALKNVLLVTTRWAEVEESVGAKREKELRENFWAYMLNNGSTMTRFYGDEASATAITSQLLSKRGGVILELQRELVDERKTLDQTVAGSFVSGDISELKKELQNQLNDLDVERQKLRETDRAALRQMKSDIERERRKMEVAKLDEERLRKDIAAEVRQEIEQKQNEKKKSGLWKVVPMLPSLLGLIELFVKFPEGSTNSLTSWFSDSGFGQSVSDFFQNF